MLKRKNSKSAHAANNKKKNAKTKTKNQPEAIKKRILRTTYVKLRQKKQIKPPRPTRKLTGSFRLFADSISLLRQHWKLFGGITLIYILLSIVLVGALSGDYSFTELRKGFEDEFGRLAASLALFSVLISTSGSPNSESGAVYQTIVVLVVSLATIWALRQVLAGEKIQIRDAFYKGMYPLVPLVLVLLFLTILFIPAVVAGFLFTVVLAGGLAVTVLEQVLWSGLILLLFIWSVYLVTNRIFAVYIVTLPDMRPMAAIRAARRLVYWRRWAVIRKLVFLPFAMFLLGAIIILPIIAFVPAIVQYVFLVLSMFALVFAHTYAYSLYKELL